MQSFSMTQQLPTGSPSARAITQYGTVSSFVWLRSQLTMTICENGNCVPVNGNHQGDDSETRAMRNSDTARMTFCPEGGTGGVGASTPRAFCWRRRMKKTIQHTIAASGKIMPHVSERPSG